jgi:hypothetical protein
MGRRRLLKGKKERRPSGTNAHAKGMAGGIGVAATPVEGGGGCSCSGKKKVKVAFRFFTLF